MVGQATTTQIESDSQMKQGLVVTPHDARTLRIMYAFGKSALYWLRELVDRALAVSGTSTGGLAKAGLQELAIYMQLVSQTLCCIGSRLEDDDDESEISAKADSREPRVGELAFKFSALTHLNVVALLTSHESDDSPSDLDSQKLRLARVFLHSLFLQALDFIHDHLSRGKGLSPQAVRDLATCVEVGIDMLEALETSTWNPRMPVPADVAGRLIDCLFDKRLEGCSRKATESLLATPFRDTCAMVFAEEEELAQS